MALSAFAANSRIRALFVLPLVLLVFCCSALKPHKEMVMSGAFGARPQEGPVTALVMPFENFTAEKGLHELVRKSFYNHFSSKNYRDIELTEVDLILESHWKNHSATWKELTPSSLGKLFHADYVLYGKVLEYKKLFAGIYSQIALKVEVEMVCCKTGEGVWRNTLIKRSHDGGIPFDLFGVIPAALRSGLHMTHERTMDLIERTNRAITAKIPDPPAPALGPFSVDIQVASFLDRELALDSVKAFERKGLRPRIETVTRNGRQWHRVLLGPYRDQGEAEGVRKNLTRESGFKPVFIHRVADQE